MRNVVVLAEYAAEVAPGEEDGPRAVVTLYARFLAEVGRDNIDFCGLGANEADARSFVTIYATAVWAEVAVFEMGVRC